MAKRPVDDLEDLSRRAARAQNQLDPTRSRPPPPFVGSSPRLMRVVLAAIAVLVVARIVSTIWFAQAAWHRWAPRQPAVTGVQRATDPPSAPRPVPPPDRRLASTALKGNPGRWFGPDAYPPDAVRRGEQGRTVAELGVDASGTPRSCAIVTGSGSRSLDAATCTIALRRIEFEPARDAAGRPIASTYRLPVRWVLPAN